MKLMLNNIGKVGNAEVKIDGITVIAGENDTGKSTVGRALFAMFNSFYRIDYQMEKERKNNVFRQLLRVPLDENTELDECVDVKSVARELAENDVFRSMPEDELLTSIYDLIRQHSIVDLTNYDLAAIGKFISNIVSVLSVSAEDFLKSSLEKKLMLEFNNQICSIYSDEPGSIQLQIKQKELSAIIEHDKVTSISNQDNMSLRTEVLYIDDPFVLDGQRLGFVIGRDLPYHREQLIRKIVSHSQSSNVIGEIIVNDKLSFILNKLSSACDGTLLLRGTRLAYMEHNAKKYLDVRNLSAGLKTFVILKALLANGSIENNGTVILDEPEVHLHPEWQLLLAELIVLIQKEFDLNILLTTHSPYFLRAIQVYSSKYGTDKVCRFYMSELVENMAQISDVSDCVDEIYAKLSHPLQKLEDERWRNNGAE